ncbi:MAG: hypothetical protein NTV06_02570 [candidate division Zixibacteria bacterium]|nr:hypothetical protein [candidate division Zixibacteria bacterium]
MTDPAEVHGRGEDLDRSGGFERGNRHIRVWHLKTELVYEKRFMRREKAKGEGFRVYRSVL